MAYQNKKEQPRERCMIAAQVLMDEFEAKQSSVAEAINCSQGTVFAWVKEVRYKKGIAYLESELESAREYAMDLMNNLSMQDVQGITYDNGNT